MFDQTFVDAQARTHRPWTVGASLLIQCILVGIALLIPLLRLAVLPRAEIGEVTLTPPIIRLAATPETVKAMASAAPSVRPIFSIPSPSPHQMATSISTPDDAPPAIGGAIGSPTGTAVFNSLITQIVPPVPPQPHSQPVKQQENTTPQTPIRVTSSIQSAKLVSGPRPPYPPLALRTRTQGTVRIQAVIGRDGEIRNLQILSGHPLLIEAAKQAVAQWRYQPTLLNGQAVEVITEIDVNFTLSQ